MGSSRNHSRDQQSGTRDHPTEQQSLAHPIHPIPDYITHAPVSDLCPLALMTISDISRYPDPVATVPTKVRAGGERVVDGWDIDSLSIEGNEGGRVRTVVRPHGWE